MRRVIIVKREPPVPGVDFTCQCGETVPHVLEHCACIIFEDGKLVEMKWICEPGKPLRVLMAEHAAKL